VMVARGIFKEDTKSGRHRGWDRAVGARAAAGQRFDGTDDGRGQEGGGRRAARLPWALSEGVRLGQAWESQ